MGMDLIGNNGQSEHLNWTGWGYFTRLMEQLGEDLSELSGLNDGDPISEERCLSFAQTLTDALKEDVIKQARFVDKGYEGGFRYEPLFIKDEADLIVDATKYDIVPLTKDDKKWLKSLAKFFKDCGGCQQW